MSHWLRYVISLSVWTAQSVDLSVLQVGKVMEPAIIVVEDCHLLFPTNKAKKKRPELYREKPMRWVRVLSRIVKKLQPGDRTLLVGITSDPFFAKTKAMAKLFKVSFQLNYLYIHYQLLCQWRLVPLKIGGATLLVRRSIDNQYQRGQRYES